MQKTFGPNDKHDLTMCCAYVLHCYLKG